MLKLNSVNGKFDIVFAGDLLLGGKEQLDFPQSGSIKRGRNTDLKSQIISKEQLRKGKSKKNIPIKNYEDEKKKKVLPPDKKPARKTFIKEHDKNIVNKSKSGKAGKITNRKEIKKKELPNINKHEEKEEHPPAETVLVNSENGYPDVSDNIMKRNTFHLQNSDVANTENAGVISREDLNKMFRGFFDDKTITATEPIYRPDSSAPALHLKSNGNLTRDHKLTYEQEEYNPWGRPGCGAPRKDKNENVVADYKSYSSAPALQLNTNGNLTRDCKLTYEQEEYNPWGRPGCGAPRKDQNENVVADYKPYSSAPASQLNNRENIIRNCPINYTEEYNPWGRPGCGAPLKDKDENVIADLKSLKSSNRSQSYPGQARTHPPTANKLQSSLNVDKTSAQQPDVNSTFARGQGRSQIELQENQKRRLKELEHQAAIKQQVEEKRRLKRLEKERELREEQEAEIRFRNEQEKLREISEKEKRKQKEQEDKMKKKQAMLEESIKRANLEAKMAKESMKQESWKNKNSGNSRENGTEEQNYVQRRLHHDEDVIVLTNKFLTKENVNNKIRENHALDVVNNGFKYEKEDYQRLSMDLNSETGNQTFTQSPSDQEFVSNYENKYSIENNTRNNNTGKSNRLSDDNNKILQQRKGFASNNMKFEKERGTRNDTRNKSKRSFEIPDFKINIEPLEVSAFENIGNDYMIPFHRTQTTELLDKSKPILTSEMKKNVNDHAKDAPKRFPDTESHSSPDVTSARQQQILNQLHTLRQGLMQKEREYVLEKYG